MVHFFWGGVGGGGCYQQHNYIVCLILCASIQVHKHILHNYTHVLKNSYFWKQVIDLQFDFLSSWFILLRNPILLKTMLSASDVDKKMKDPEEIA